MHVHNRIVQSNAHSSRDPGARERHLEHHDEHHQQHHSVEEEFVAVGDQYAVKGRSYLITGGLGYLGRRLCEALVRHGARRVCLADVRSPGGLDEDSRRQIAGASELFVGDIRDEAAVAGWVAASGPADCVLHVCSFGMSGREMLEREKTWQINVDGTTNVCKACARHGAALVYVSTVNVCFDGSREVVGGDETAAYATQHVDAYSASKVRAEQTCRQWPGVRCVSIRPYGIYGEGEERHFPRMLGYFKRGLYSRIGRPSTRSDWVHVDNLVHACLLADQRLSLPDRATIDGDAFFVGDGEPVNTVAMCEPLWRMVSGADPSGLRAVWLPTWLVYSAGWLIEQLYRLSTALPGRCAFDPLLSRAEVNKVALTHYWKTERVRSLLGYRPVVSRQHGLQRMYAYFQRQLIEQGYPQRFQTESSVSHRRITVLLVLLLFIVLYFIFF